MIGILGFVLVKGLVFPPGSSPGRFNVGHVILIMEPILKAYIEKIPSRNGGCRRDFNRK